MIQRGKLWDVVYGIEGDGNLNGHTSNQVGNSFGFEDYNVYDKCVYEKL